MLSKLTTSQNAAIRLHKELSTALSVIKQVPVDEDNNSADGQGRGVLLNAKSNTNSEETGHQVSISNELKERLIQEILDLLPKIEQQGDKLSEIANNSSLWEAYRKEAKKQQAEESKKLNGEAKHKKEIKAQHGTPDTSPSKQPQKHNKGQEQSKHVDQPKPLNSWSCSKCTYDNLAWSTQCEICKSIRDNESDWSFNVKKQRKASAEDDSKKKKIQPTKILRPVPSAANTQSSSPWNNSLKPPSESSNSVNYASVAGSRNSSPSLNVKDRATPPSKSPTPFLNSSPQKVKLPQQPTFTKSPAKTPNQFPSTPQNSTENIAQQMMDFNLGTNVIGVNNPVYTPPPQQHGLTQSIAPPHAFHAVQAPLQLQFGSLNGGDTTTLYHPIESKLPTPSQSNGHGLWASVQPTPPQYYSRFHGNSSHPRDVDFVAIDRENTNNFVPIEEFPLSNSSLWAFSGTSTGDSSMLNGTTDESSWSSFGDRHHVGFYNTRTSDPFYPSVDSRGGNSTTTPGVFYDNYSAFSNSPFPISNASVTLKGPSYPQTKHSPSNATPNETTSKLRCASQPCAVCAAESMFECNFCSGLRRKGIPVPSTFFCDAHLSSSTWKEHQKVHEQYS
jgi:hypothetical protein